MPSDKQAPADPRISVMDWLLAVGRLAVRRLKPLPPSPMVRVHGR